MGVKPEIESLLSAETTVSAVAQAFDKTDLDFRAILEAVPAAIYVTDAQGRITHYNQAAVEFAGRRPVLGSDNWCVTFKLYEPDGTFMPHEECPMAVALKEGRAVRGQEAIAERPDGTRVPFLPFPTPLFDASGRLIGAVNLLVDISTVKEAQVRNHEMQNELRIKDAELDLVTKVTPLMLHRCDKDMRYRYVNPAAARLFGLVPDEMIGRKVEEVMGAETFAKIEPHIRKVLDGEEAEYEFEIPFPSGAKWVHVNYVPERSETGEVVGWIASKVDLTERKALEEAQERQLRKIRATYELSSKTARTHDLDTIIDAALDALMTAVAADRAAVLLFDETGVMKFSGWRNLSQTYREAVEGHSPWKPGDVDAKTIAVDDVLLDKDLEAFRQTITVEGIRSLAFIPLVTDTGILGKFMVYYDAPHAFSESQVQVCETIASHVTFAIEKARAYKAVHESEALFRVMADSSPALVWINGHQGCEYVNKAYLDFVGGELKDVQRFDWTKYIHPNDHDDYLRTYLEAYGQRKPYNAQFRLLRHDDEYRWTKTTGVPRFGEDGEFLGFVGSTFDVTDLKEKEEALRESEERFRLATASGLVGVWDWDIATNAVKWSDTTYFIHGVTRETFGGTVEAFQELIHPEDRDFVQDAISRALERNDPYEIEFRVVQPRGKTVWLYTHARVLHDKTGKPTRMLGGTLDITERKNAELQLRESESYARGLSDRLRVLLNMTSHLIETLETGHLFETILDLSRSIVAADAFGVWRTAEKGTWNLVASKGLSEDFLRESLNAGRFATVPETPIVIQPSDLIERGNPTLRDRWKRYEREGVCSLMILPLRIHGKVDGTLVFYCKSPHEFSQIEVESATAMANIAASAITTSELNQAQAATLR